MVPLLACNLDTEGVEFFPPGKLERWNETCERDHSLHYWSSEFEDKLEMDYLKPVLNAEGKFPVPGTYHPCRV